MPDLWVVAACSAAAAGVGAWLIWSRPSAPKGYKPIPKSWLTIPFIGDTLALGVEGPVKYAWSRYNRLGPIFHTNLFMQPMILVGEPSLVKAVMGMDSMELRVPVFASERLLGDISLAKDSARNKIFRKHTLPALNSAAHKGYLPAMLDLASQHMERWAQQGIVDFAEAGRALIMDFVIDVIMGLPLASTTREEVHQLASVFMQGLFVAPLDLPGTKYRKALQARPKLVEILRREVPLMLQQRQLEAEPGWYPPDKPGLQEVKGVPASMDLAAAAGRTSANLSDSTMAEALATDHMYFDYVAERVLHNIVGAAETTINQLLAALVLVGREPGVMQRLVEEQRQVMSEHGPELTFQALTASKYADAVTKEAARVAPSTHLLFREAMEDVAVGDYFIPKGSMVALSVDLAHSLDPVMLATAGPAAPSGIPAHQDLARPERCFKPHRWLDERTRPKVLMTWGSGTHYCLGVNLAQMEIKMVLALLARGYDWAPLKQYHLEAMPQPHVTNGPPLFRVSRRQVAAQAS